MISGEESGLCVVDALNERGSHIPVALITGESLSDGEIAESYPDLVMLQKPVSNDALLGLLDYMLASEDEEEHSDARDDLQLTSA